MGIFILIIIFSGSGKSVATAEFGSLEKCQAAAAAVHARERFGETLYAICAEK